MEKRVRCKRCSNSILPETSRRLGGICKRCSKSISARPIDSSKRGDRASTVGGAIAAALVLAFVVIFCCRTPSSRYGDDYTPTYSPSSSSSSGSSESLSSPSSTTGGNNYERTNPGYDPNAPLLPRHKGDVEPLYNEVQRRKSEQGISDKEAVRQIVEESERR